MKTLYLGPSDTFDHVKAELKGYDVRLALDDATVDREIADIDVILDAYMKVRFGADRLKKAVKLRLVVTATTGADHIDEAALSARGIPLLTLKGQPILRDITPAAEHSWLLLMACARQLKPALKHVTDGRWDRNQFPGVMLNGKTIGIIGCGRIGQWMARYAAAFGLKCLGYDPFLSEWPNGIEKCELKDLLVRSDFVTVHVTLSEQSKGLLGPAEFAAIKPGAILVNTSRGEIIDGSSLLAALESGKLRAAGLDVLTGEPDTVHNPLVEYARKRDNLLITPHIGGYSPDALVYLLTFCCKRIKDYFEAHK